MAINASKTGLMLVSAASSFEAKTSLKLNGQKITGSSSLRILGVTIDDDMSFKSHIEKIAVRTSSKTWALAKLRKKGLSEDKLVKTTSA